MESANRRGRRTGQGEGGVRPPTEEEDVTRVPAGHPPPVAPAGRAPQGAPADCTGSSSPSSPKTAPDQAIISAGRRELALEDAPPPLPVLSALLSPPPALPFPFPGDPADLRSPELFPNSGSRLHLDTPCISPSPSSSPPPIHTRGANLRQSLLVTAGGEALNRPE